MVLGLLEQRRTAQTAAAVIKASNPHYETDPLALGILLRIAFPASTQNPVQVCQALEAAGYAKSAALTAALKTLFPLSQAEATAAIGRVFT